MQNSNHIIFHFAFCKHIQINYEAEIPDVGREVIQELNILLFAKNSTKTQ